MVYHVSFEVLFQETEDRIREDFVRKLYHPVEGLNLLILDDNNYREDHSMMIMIHEKHSNQTDEMSVRLSDRLFGENSVIFSMLQDSDYS